MFRKESEGLLKVYRQHLALSQRTDVGLGVRYKKFNPDVFRLSAARAVSVNGGVALTVEEDDFVSVPHQAFCHAGT